MVASNAAGAVVVFVFANAVLPVPAHLHHTLRLVLINAAVFVVTGALACVYASIRSERLWKRRMIWATEDRPPTEAERDQTLLYPLSQTKLNAQLWGVAAIGFARTHGWPLIGT